MAWRAKENISSPRGTCAREEIPRGFQPTFMAECIKDGSLYNDGEDDQDEPELAVGDTLEGYNRQALMTIISLNKLPITVMKKWTDGQVRQAIRDIVADVTKLSTQPARTGEMDAATLSPLQ